MSSLTRLHKFISIAEYASEMGLGWTLFRVKHAVKQRLGAGPRQNRRIVRWQESNRAKVGALRNLDRLEITPPVVSGEAVARADSALNGKIRAFSSTDFDLGSPPDWFLNPITGLKAPQDLPWQKISDFGPWGDIKGVWEASRFPHTFLILSAAASHPLERARLGKQWLNQVESWIDQNPFPNGPHYKCGQEISFRILSWVLGVAYFRDLMNVELSRKIALHIAVSAKRIDSYLDFATQSVRNNHSLSEALGLILCGTVVDHPEAKGWIKKGVRTLDKETSYQVFADGAYIQHSTNYSRLALDVLSTAVSILRRTDLKPSQQLLTAHGKLFKFLYAMVENSGHTGAVPCLGANDGALLYPFPGSNYLDFRDSIEFAARIHRSISIFPDRAALATAWGLPVNESMGRQPPLAETSFPVGGFYWLKTPQMSAMLRSHSYVTRPSHCDPHHLDLWVDGKNILCDSGSFSYNADPKLIAEFVGMSGHNTVRIDGEEPMERVGHFGWKNWIQTTVKVRSLNRWISVQRGYFKSKGLLLEREVTPFLDESGEGFVVRDRIVGVKNPTHVQQIWNTRELVAEAGSALWKVGPLQIESNLNGAVTAAQVSRFYSILEQSSRLIFESTTNKDVEIVTTIRKPKTP